MLPLGMVSGGSTNATGRSTYFTTNEQYTLMSLWAIARSPLILGADMTQMDPFTLSLLTNDAVIAVNQSSLHNRQLFRTNDVIAWTADAEGSTNKYLALFNTAASTTNIPVSLLLLGYTNACAIRSLWDGTDLGSFSGTFSPAVLSHRGALYRLSGPALPVPWITNAAAGNHRVLLGWEGIGTASSYSVKRSTSETGPYQTIATGIANVSYTDLSAQNATTYYYVISAIVGGQPSPDSGASAATPAGASGIVGWNYDRYGTLNSNNPAGIVATNNWNDSYPNDPVANLVDNNGAPTTVAIAYNSYNTWSIKNSHPGADANGSYNKELLNGYLNSGAGQIPATSTVSITQIPFSYYNLYVYFSSDTAGRTGTVTDGTTTYSFTTIGSASIFGANAVLTQTTDTGTGYPSANYALFAGISGAIKTITCDIPLFGGIAGFQIVPLADPLPGAVISIQFNGGTSVSLSWPTGLGMVVLQQSPDLRNWAPVNPQPATNSAVVTVASVSQFFRLSRP